MIRKAFRAAVFPGQHLEYARRHSPIWRELEEQLICHGVRTYSIYLDPATNDLFGYVEVASEDQWAAIAATDVCRSTAARRMSTDGFRSTCRRPTSSCMIRCAAP